MDAHRDNSTSPGASLPQIVLRVPDMDAPAAATAPQTTASDPFIAGPAADMLAEGRAALDRHARRLRYEAAHAPLSAPLATETTTPERAKEHPVPPLAAAAGDRRTAVRFDRSEQPAKTPSTTASAEGAVSGGDAPLQRQLNAVAGTVRGTAGRAARGVRAWRERVGSINWRSELRGLVLDPRNLAVALLMAAALLALTLVGGPQQQNQLPTKRPVANAAPPVAEPEQVAAQPEPTSPGPPAPEAQQPSAVLVPDTGTPPAPAEVAAAAPPTTETVSSEPALPSAEVALADATPGDATIQAPPTEKVAAVPDQPAQGGPELQEPTPPAIPQASTAAANAAGELQPPHNQPAAQATTTTSAALPQVMDQDGAPTSSPVRPTVITNPYFQTGGATPTSGQSGRENSDVPASNAGAANHATATSPQSASTAMIEPTGATTGAGTVTDAETQIEGGYAPWNHTDPRWGQPYGAATAPTTATRYYNGGAATAPATTPLFNAPGSDYPQVAQRPSLPVAPPDAALPRDIPWPPEAASRQQPPPASYDTGAARLRGTIAQPPPGWNP